mgnify:CR=1 FL=1
MSVGRVSGLVMARNGAAAPVDAEVVESPVDARPKRPYNFRRLPPHRPASRMLRIAAVAVLTTAFLLVAGLQARAAAQTFFESSLPGGEFSRDFANPTPIPGDHDTVVGTGVVGHDDMIVFRNLAPGAQTLRFTVARPAGAPANHNGTGTIVYKLGAFNHDYDGTRLAQYRINNGNRVHSYALHLDDSYDGRPLSVAFYFTSGAAMDWRIEGITTAPPPPPPGPCSDQGLFSQDMAPGGAFSTDVAAPTVVGPGWSGIRGESPGGRNRFIVYEGLPGGAQTLTLTFRLPANQTQQWAGGEVLFSQTPFPWAWAGTSAGTFALSPASQSATITIVTDAGFGGTLYLGLMLTYGQRIAFTGTRAPCPDPAGLPDIAVKKGVFVVDQTGQVCAALADPGLPAPQAAIPGACIEFVIRTGNDGDGWATDLTVTDLLGPQFTFVAAEINGFDTTRPGFALTLPPANADCSAVTCTVQLVNAGLAPGQIGDIRIRTLLK